jgi:hypothetical protein
MSPVQSLEVIGFKKETTFGTFLPPTSFVPGTATFNTNTKIIRPTQSRGVRGFPIDGIVGLEAGVQITAELIGDVLSDLVAGSFGVGSDVVTGSAGVGFTHTLTPQGQLPSYSVEVDHDISAQVLARQTAGCQVASWTLKATNQQLATLDFQLIGQRELTPTTPGLPSNPTPVITTVQPFDFSLLAATYKAVSTTQLADLTLGFDNQVQRVFTNNQQLYVSRLVPTMRNVTFQTTLDFLDTVFYADWIVGNRQLAFNLTFTSLANIVGATNPYQIVFNLPGLRPNGQFNLQSANDVLNQQITWSATVNGPNEINSVWRNSEAGALA